MSYCQDCADSEKRIKELEQKCAKLEAKNERLHILLARYRDEVPLGHQPHMVAHLVDAELGDNWWDAKGGSQEGSEDWTGYD